MDKNTPANSSRRRMLTGSVAAPVVLTLTSMPVLAETCTTASASTSMSPSGVTRHRMTPCEGLSPSEWVTLESWPNLDGNTNNNDKNEKFNDHFTTKLMGNPTPTLLAVLGEGYGAFAAACVATYLNVKSGRVNEAMLGEPRTAQAIWDEVKTTGILKVSSSVEWNEDQVVDWLAKTWT